MPAVTNIVLNDAQATPVAHTFVPVGQDTNGVWWFEDQSQATPAGYWKISVKMTRPAPAAPGKATDGRKIPVRICLYEPVLENVTNSTVSGVAPAPVVSYLPWAEVNFILPERASLQNRKDLRKMLASLLADTSVVAVVETLQALY